jgi:hypothetical protein
VRLFLLVSDQETLSPSHTLTLTPFLFLFLLFFHFRFLFSSLLLFSFITGNHDPSLNDTLHLAGIGYKGLASITKLAYRVVFHKSATDYPCDTWCSNVNKLFGFSRGFTPVEGNRYPLSSSSSSLCSSLPLFSFSLSLSKLHFWLESSNATLRTLRNYPNFRLWLVQLLRRALGDPWPNVNSPLLFFSSFYHT